MRELIIDYLDGNLSGELKQFVVKHIKKTDKWKNELARIQEMIKVIDNTEELEPPEELKTDFEMMLEKEMQDESESIEKIVEAKTIYWNTPRIWYQIAASIALLAVGLFAGYKITNNNTRKEMLALRQEMEMAKQLVLSSLDNTSASSRIRAVNATYNIQTMDDDIVNALVETMNTDDNANVRLAAIDALSQFTEEEKVRSSLIESLKIQDKPVVQIALINILVQIKEERAATVFQQIIEDKESLSTVKDEASYGLYKL